MKRTQHLYILSFLLSLSLFSCMDDDLVEGKGITSGSVTLRGELSVPSASEVVTRNAGEISDVTISDITVLAFDNTGADTTLTQKAVGILSANNSFTVKLTTRSGSTLIYVLANAGSLTIPDAGAKLSDVRKSLVHSINSGSIDNGYVASAFALPLPMSGKLLLPNGITGATVINKSGVKGDNPLPMVRSVAKFSVETATKVTNFKLTGAALCRVSSAGHIISNQPDANDIFSQPDDSQELLAAERITYYDNQSEDFLFTTTGSSIDNMYAYETKAKGGESVKLVIRGLYTTDNNVEKEVYYLLGLIDTHKKNYDVVRNHHYKVTINKVAVEGASTFSEAFNGVINNDTELKFEVTDDSHFGTTVFTGGYEFSLDYDEVTVYCDSIDNYTLSFLATDFDGAEGAVNRLQATSNNVNGQPTLYFSNNATESTLVIATGAQKGTKHTYPINVNIKSGFTEGVVRLRLTNYEKNIIIRNKGYFDLHYSSLEMTSVLNIKKLSNNGSNWVTLSAYTPYISQSQVNNLEYGTPSAAYIYITENMELEARYTDLECTRMLSPGGRFFKSKLLIGQVGTKRYNIGYWNGNMANNGYQANYQSKLLVEAYEEDEDAVPLIKDPVNMKNFEGYIMAAIETPKTATDYLHRSGQSPAATRCINKNRDENGDGEITNDEIKWYLPSARQAVGISLYQASIEGVKPAYWTSSVENISGAASNAFSLVTYKAGASTYPNYTHNADSQLSNAHTSYIDRWQNNHWEERYVRCVRDF